MLNSEMRKPAGDMGGVGERRGHMQPEQAWDRVKRRLRAELGEDVFSSWFARLDFAELREGTAYLTVPTRFLKSWIQSHYIEKMRALFVDECSDVRQIAVGVRTGTQRLQPRLACQTESAAAEAQPAALAPERPQAPSLPAFRLPTGDGDGLAGSPLDRRLTFASFLVGHSNALAHAAGARIARVPAGAAALYNPLYVHACVGLGKTHLLQAIAHEMLAAERRVIYLTADRFMYGFVAALKAQTALAFKERLRGIDLLVIDDVQFLQGKTIQQEFCHTINALIDAGKQVVIAADRQPADLESLDERIRSRLAGGLVVEMGALDEELRVKMLDNRIAAARTHQPGFEVSPAVVAYVARMIVTNGRDLEGAVNRLLAHMSLSGAPLTVEVAETAIRDLVRSREPKKVRIEDIQKLVATHYSVSRADILSSRRSASVVKPRQIAMYLAKQLTLRSLPEIGRRFGGRDHTTVLHAVRKIDAAVAQDAGLKDEVDLLKRMLQD